MKKLLIFVLVLMLAIGVGGYLWLKQANPTMSPTHTIRSVINQDGGTFEFKSNGDIVVHTQDCEDPWIGEFHQHAEPNRRATVIEGVNHKTDNVERVSSQFLRIDGKIYDAFVGEFQRAGIDKTNHIANNLVEASFQVTDEEEQYFTDGENYYYYEYYPTFRACFLYNEESEPIVLSEFQLNSPGEAQLYLGQDNNLFITDPIIPDRDKYTPFAVLNEQLYFKSKSGQFVLVPNVNPQGIQELGETYTGHLFTDGEHIIFQGEVLDLDVSTFRQIKANQMNTRFFVIEDSVYYLHIPINAFFYDASLIETDIDAESFEAIDKTGSYSGIVYQDKDFTYTLAARDAKEIEKTRRVY